MVKALQPDFWANEDAELIDSLFEIVMDDIADGFAGGVALLPGQVQALVDWDWLNEAALELAKTYRYEHIRRIGQTTLRQVQRAINDWMLTGEPLKNLEKRLEKLFDPMRAARIAATETTRIYADANMTSWMASGVVGSRQWMTAEDDLVCPICGEGEGGLSGVIVPMDQPFSPDVDNPPAHVNCRCWIQPVVDTESVGAKIEEVLQQFEWDESLHPRDERGRFGEGGVQDTSGETISGAHTTRDVNRHRMTHTTTADKAAAIVAGGFKTGSTNSMYGVEGVYLSSKPVSARYGDTVMEISLEPHTQLVVDSDTEVPRVVEKITGQSAYFSDAATKLVDAGYKSLSFPVDDEQYTIVLDPSIIKVTEVKGPTTKLEWDESLHPRDERGRFGEGGGSSSEPKSDRPSVVPGIDRPTNAQEYLENQDKVWKKYSERLDPLYKERLEIKDRIAVAKADLVQAQEDYQVWNMADSHTDDERYAKMDELGLVEKDGAVVGSSIELERCEDQIITLQTARNAECRAQLYYPSEERGELQALGKYPFGNIDAARALTGGINDIEGIVDPDILASTSNKPVMFRARMGSGRCNYGNKTIQLFENYLTKGTVVHEVGHYLEDVVPGVHKAANYFLEDRTRGEEWQRLSDLAPNRGYDPDEWAKPDKFLSAYMGKSYPDATEIVSMGIQYLVEDPQLLATKDPEYFDFILGIIQPQKGKP